MYCSARQITNIYDINTALLSVSTQLPPSLKIIVTNLSFLSPNIKMKRGEEGILIVFLQL